MKYLGIDYGKRKVGLSISVGKLAVPFKVIVCRDEKELLAKVRKIKEEERIDKLVVGVSEGEMAKKQKDFANKLEATIFDESLSTQDAISMSISAGIGRKKRKRMEDAYAATIILQRYLDT